MSLPTSVYPTEDGSGARRHSSLLSNVPVAFRRLHRFKQMDFEQALWQLTYLCIAPKRVYRNVYFHKQTKNTWQRDDPAIIILISAALFISALMWSFAYSLGMLAAIQLALIMVLRDFVVVGLIVASILWLFSNRALLSPPSHSTPADSHVEWGYAFDVHINAFFPLFLTLYVAQLFLLPIVLKTKWVCLFLGNTLYFVGFAQYIYGIYLGFNGMGSQSLSMIPSSQKFPKTALPFLSRTELLLAPLLPLLVAYVLSLLGFNVAKNVLLAYFGS